MRNYQFILWDWDGCLANTSPLHLKAYKKAFAAFGKKPSDLEITNKVFGSWNGPKKLGIKRIKEFTSLYLEYLHKEYSDAPLYENAEKALAYLKKKNKKMALITTSKRKTILPVLEKTKTKKYLQVILTAEDVLRHKPNPEMIIKALARLKGKRERAIIIGDSKSDLGAANNAQVDSILFYPQSHQKFYELDYLKTFRPTYIIDNLIQVKEIIK